MYHSHLMGFLWVTQSHTVDCRSRQSWAIIDGWNFTWIRKFVKKSFFKESWKKCFRTFENISCFRIVMWFLNCWRNKFFSAVILRCTISPGKHGYEPPKHKMLPFSQNSFFSAFFIFFRNWDHTYLCSGKVWKNVNFFIFNTSARFLQTTTLKKGKNWYNYVIPYCVL